MEAVTIFRVHQANLILEGKGFKLELLKTYYIFRKKIFRSLHKYYYLLNKIDRLFFQKFKQIFKQYFSILNKNKIGYSLDIFF